MKVLAFDLETTGLLEDPNTRVTEIGWAIWNTEFKRIESSFSALLSPAPGQPAITKEIENLTGVTDRLLARTSTADREYIMDAFRDVALECDAYMARNGEAFDIPMLKKEFEMEKTKWVPKPCIDEYLDLDWPEWVKGKTLSHIAADHGFLNPFPHIALGDVLTMLKVWEKGGYDITKAFELASSPVVRVIARVSFDDKDKAKAEGFQWDPDSRKWWKNFRKSKIEIIKDDLGFGVWWDK